MKRILSMLAVAALALVAIGLPAARHPAAAAAKPAWSMNATAIEACSCPMFCQCYFGSGQPAGHHEMGSNGGMDMEHHYCKFNNAYRVNKGNYQGTKLDGVTFWISGDLGGDFTKGQMDWAVVTIDRKATKAQKDGVLAIVPHIFPVKWNSLTVADGDISWSAKDGEAVALLDGGKSGEVRLSKGGFGEAGQIPVIKGLQYWGVDHNDGFVLMPNTIEAYRLGDKAYEFKGSNGFMLTFDIAEHPEAKGKS